MNIAAIVSLIENAGQRAPLPTTLDQPKDLSQWLRRNTIFALFMQARPGCSDWLLDWMSTFQNGDLEIWELYRGKRSTAMTIQTVMGASTMNAKQKTLRVVSLSRPNNFLKPCQD